MKLLAALILSLCLASDAIGALAVVQSVSASSNGAVTSVTTGNITTTAGNLIVCDIAYYGVFVSFVDSKGNTFVDAVAEMTGSDPDGHLRQMYKENAAGGATHNFTLTLSPAGYPSINCTEISGASTSGALDKTSSNAQETGVGDPRTSGSTAGTVQNAEILKGACTSPDTGTFTSLGSFTDNFNAATDADTMGLVSAYEISSAAGAKAYTASLDLNLRSLCLIGTYKEAAAGGAVVVGPRRRGW